MTVVIGGTGILGKTLKEIDSDLICLNSEYDIFQFDKLKNKLDSINPKLIINCAAIKSERVIENPVESINVNIIGSCNLSKYCIENLIRLVYISTDYVYSGLDGNYSEHDEILPSNLYAWTKLGGESCVKLVPNHLIIRTSFGETKFPYDIAFDNLITSKDYVDIIAPMILKASNSIFVGTMNIGTEPKSIYEYASKRNQVNKGSLISPKNYSLNTKEYEKLFETH
jgi:dTDP-4-dehydrorhamnose reductase